VVARRASRESAQDFRAPTAKQPMQTGKVFLGFLADATILHEATAAQQACA